jgi:hypothetical protein
VEIKMGDKIEKQQHEVIIYTRIMKIDGYIHVAPGERISDFLSSKYDENFIPVTNVKISEIVGSATIQRAEYLSINKNEIICLIPKSNLLKN